MIAIDKKALRRELTVIFVLSIFLAVVYNMFSGSGLPLIRTEPKKVTVADSVLFQRSSVSDSTRIAELVNDTAKPRDVKVIAPLHERALRNPDSIAHAVGQEQTGDQTFKVLSLGQVKRLLAEKRGVFIDARSAEDFRKAHIRGAVNIPGDDPGKHFAELVNIPRDTLVVIYCNGPLCDLGHSVAEFMRMMEFKGLFLYDDGWDGWVRAGLENNPQFTMKEKL